MMDILIIGSGAAGSMAAARAKERGLSCLWVSDSLGATGYSSGAIDQLPKTKELELFLRVTHGLSYKLCTQAINHTGQIRSCALVQGTQWVDWDHINSESLLGVVGVPGVFGFCAESVAKMLRHQGLRAEAVELDDYRVRSAGFAHLFFPATREYSRLSQGVTCPSSELLGASHSPAGLRLAEVLRKGCVQDKVLSCERVSHQIVNITLEAGGMIKPKQIILATGTHLTNGYIFGLQAGLKVDEQQRPLDRFGEIFATNLRAAGSIIHGPGLGKAIESGYRAAELCCHFTIGSEIRGK
jgi:hypothetical protein